MSEIFECPFCGLVCKNKRGLTRHIKSCKNNPDRVDGPTKGYKHTEETKQLLSYRHTGKTLSEESKQKISNANKGEKNGFYGKRHTEESKRKMSEAGKGRTGENSSMYGKHHTEEVKQKLSEARVGKYTGENHPNYGKHLADETKQKISVANKGKKASNETKQKLIEAQKIAQNRPEVKQKRYDTMKQNNSFNTSKIEIELQEWFRSQNIDFLTEYVSKQYPTRCDFYLPKYDLYIEIQGSWTHGPEPFDSNNPEHIELLNIWKSKNSKYYDIAIDTWTVRDVKKRETAKANKLNWIEIFSIDLEECINIIQMHIKD